MRVLLNLSGDVPSNDLRMENKDRLTDHLGKLWDEWEIQVLVLVSFALQAFLLLFSGIRKRRTPGVLSKLLWLAYLSADSLAMFVLGHLTLHINGPRHGLTLFWAPFMLLHLGGQETITAFSMEDNALWKRHLLSLVTQVGLAAYVVGKQWQGDKQLLAPMVLMFIAGTIKYAGRTSALMLAAKPLPYGDRDRIPPDFRTGIDMQRLSSNLNTDDARRVMKGGGTYQEQIRSAFCQLFQNLTLLTETKPWAPRIDKPSAQAIQSNEHRVHDCYKIVEVHLSFVYDYFYTKLGARFSHADRLNGRCFRLLTQGSTFTALVVFACKADHFGHQHYSRADVAVSYILLIGAVILEMISVFIVTSSYWVYGERAPEEITYERKLWCCPRLRAATLFNIFKVVRPSEGTPQWSHKLAQYNMVDGAVNAAQSSCVGRVMRRIGIKSDTTRVALSAELKKLLLDKLLEFAPADATGTEGAWDPASKFTGHWARSELRRQSSSGPMLEALLTTKSNLDPSGFMSTVLTWHIATDLCFFHDDDQHSNSKSPSITMTRELSNYVMYLCAEHGVMSGSEGDVLHRAAQTVLARCYEYTGSPEEKHHLLVKCIRYSESRTPVMVRQWRGRDTAIAAACVFMDALQLSEELNIKEAGDRWKIIMNIWMEVLCYMAAHTAPAEFHTKHLSEGGEFITHVKALMFNLGLATPLD